MLPRKAFIQLVSIGVLCGFLLLPWLIFFRTLQENGVPPLPYLRRAWHSFTQSLQSLPTLPVFAQAQQTRPSTGTTTIDFGGLLMFLLVAAGALWLVFKFRGKKQKAADWEALPQDGPMKVSIKEEPVAPNEFNSKRFKCRLRINVVISQKDWRAINSAGLMDLVLFNYPTPSGDEEWHFQVKNLKQEMFCEFFNQQQMLDAKEQLIQGLKNLRSQIDHRREGVKHEMLEI